MSVPKSLAIIAGAGPGTGAAIARAFASKGFAVALLARTASNLATLESEISQSGGTAASFPTDLTQPRALQETFKSIQAKFPESQLKVAVFNLNTRWTVKPFLELQEEEFNGVVQGQIGSAFRFSQLALKDLKKEGGTLIFTGATAATRGSAKFAALATASFAVRALSQSLAREFQPQGVHVAHAIIDGIIDTERAQAITGSSVSAATGERLDPSEIAKAFVYLHEQAPSAWTHELDLRPSKGKW
ncbi:hypothetical protein M408DRAFT_328748 [Serendipita vermifera MAFF 305830]|uniref:Short-chain dehydrogenase/reductase SDR n=1 Tax=Serendipita vermifera MAFF 305830 TaxID=933852 RepID=A0A0C3BDH2_SERVB|nr:hypothetical protein M408DRAFT_328748 [Serendipita vermifera MAFF 305830]